jgi:glycosyltransferase involved in cell wall biosynthesis
VPAAIKIGRRNWIIPLVKRIAAIVSAVYPFPVDTGKKRVLAGIIEYLSTRAMEVHYIYIAGDGVVCKSSAITVHTIRKPRALAQIFRVAMSAMVLRHKSLQECMLFSQRVSAEINQKLQHIKPDLVIYDTIRLGQYLESNSMAASRVLYMEDLFSDRYNAVLQAMCQTGNVNIDALGNFGSFLPPICYRAMRARHFQKLLLAYEADIVRKREVQLAGLSDRALLLNSREAHRLAGQVSGGKVRVIKPLLQPRQRCVRDFCGQPQFCFVGSLAYALNELAMVNFMKHVMRTVVSFLPDVQLQIVGASPNESFVSVAEEHREHITFPGYVDDIDAIYRSSAALIAPMTIAGGIKLKILEALQAGTPVLTTPAGVDGISDREPPGCIVEPNLSRFPYWMKRLCELPFNQSLSDAGSEFFETHFGRETIMKEYDTIFDYSPAPGNHRVE